MKKNERIQLKSATLPELEKRVQEARVKLLALQREIGLGKVKNPHEAKALRKDIARMLTEITSQNAK